jgi:uncharacterized DUF497 family protein
MRKAYFDWDDVKNDQNIKKHDVSFGEAQDVFFDPKRIIAEDLEHNSQEKRFFCFGRVKERIMTVRFTYRDNVIRIFGAGYWRKGKKIYENAQKEKI